MGKEVLMSLFGKEKIIKFLGRSLCAFNISQKDPVILSLFKKHLKCGTIRERKLMEYGITKSITSMLFKPM
jgi:hypothetical protein